MGRLTIDQLWRRCDAMCEIEGRQGNVHGEVYKVYSSIRQYLKELQRYKDLEEQGRLIEQKHGRWIANKHMVKSPTAENYHCSECTQTGKGTQYCPNCGARMELKELEDE